MLWPASRSAFSYSGFASLNTSALLEIVDRRVCMECGIFLVTVGGWLDSTWAYSWVLPGFENGLRSLLLRSNVTSRKSTTVELALAVTWRPIFLNFSHSFFFMVSAALRIYIYIYIDKYHYYIIFTQYYIRHVNIEARKVRGHSCMVFS